jgi:multicomponent Na+:H+ antiporter subunit F
MSTALGLAAPATKAADSPRGERMSTESILEYSCTLARITIAISLLIALYRLARGPTLPDRVVAVDMLSFLVVAYIAVLVVATGNVAFLDAASTLALITFVSTVAFARYIEKRAEPDRRGQEEGGGP